MKKVFVLLVFIFSAVFISAQVNENNPGEKKYVIHGIKVDGGLFFDSAFIMKFADLKIGDTVTMTGGKIATSLANLVASGAFKNVEIKNTGTYGDSIYLEIAADGLPPATSTRAEDQPKEDSAGFSILVALIVCAVIFFLVFHGIQKTIGFAAKEISNISHSKFVSNINVDANERMEIENSLVTFRYYQKLSFAGKEKFLYKTIGILRAFDISGAEGYEPDDVTRYHVAAAAAQLTFGLNDFEFEHFDSIVLYPAIFKLSPNAPAMKGGTTPDGIIRISVKDFDEGYKNPGDKLNVGLHEIGHALFMEFLRNVQFEENEADEKANMIHPYIAEADKILNAGKEHDNFLRDYAFTNRHEFFAVTVEHFFEASDEFKEKLPKLYTVMSQLLNQDPSNVNHDYVLATIYSDNIFDIPNK